MDNMINDYIQETDTDEIDSPMTEEFIQKDVSDIYADQTTMDFNINNAAYVDDNRQRGEKTKKKPKITGVTILAIIVSTAVLSSICGASAAYGMFKFLQKETSSAAFSNHSSESEKDKKNTENGNSASDDQDEKTVTILESGRDTKVEVESVDNGTLMTAAQVYRNNAASTVGIQTEITTTNYWGYTTSSSTAGSGFILTEDGYILTNFHVIEDSNAITVATYEGEKYDAYVIGYNENLDIAVLKVNADGFVPVVLGDSSAMNVGDQVVAIGNPLGELTFSLTSGYVSALEREVTLSSTQTMTLIQTDCAINSGNSGGALFNMYGEVIGITNAKMSNSGYSSSASIDNIGFAIPINSVRQIVKSMIEKGYYSKPYIGITVSNVSSDAQRFGFPAGAAVYSVVEGAPAEESGLQTNDIITEVNGTRINTANELINFIGKCDIGDALSVRVYRNNEYVELVLIVGESIESTLPTGSKENGSNSSGTQPGNSGSGNGFNR